MQQQDKQSTGAELINFPARNFHGAAIVGANGEETPITESMVNQALDSLMKCLPTYAYPLSSPINR